MNTLLKTLLGFCLLLSFTSCLEFEKQEIVYHHDQEKDEIRMTLCYEGIFGNLKGGQNMEKNAEDKATPDKLNLLQIEQLASVLNEKQAFFFSNWIFEYRRAALKQMLKKEPKPSSRTPKSRTLASTRIRRDAFAVLRRSSYQIAPKSSL